MNRDFKGIWIPKEIWLSDLSCQEKCLWAEIHSLYDPERDGCFASNEYLCDFMGVKERRLQEMIANLKKKGWLIQVSFDGRIRTIKAIEPSRINGVKRCGKVHPSGAGKCTPSVRESAPGGTLSPYILENKDKRKEERKPAPSSKKKKQKEVVKKLQFGTYVELKEGEYQDLCSSFGQQIVDSTIIKINDWVPNNHYYKDYAAAIRTWVRKEKEFVKNDSKAIPGSPNNNTVPYDPDSFRNEKKAISERIRGIVAPYCNDRTYFNLTETDVTIRCKVKDINSTYRFGDTDARFKEKLLHDVQIAFPQVRDQILGNGQLATRFAQDLVNKFKR